MFQYTLNEPTVNQDPNKSTYTSHDAMATSYQMNRLDTKEMNKKKILIMIEPRCPNKRANIEPHKKLLKKVLIKGSKYIYQNIKV
jgi:hypothetical protein